MSLKEVHERGHVLVYQQKCILVIDDDDQIRAMLKEMLVRGGYEVLSASDGNEGIRLYREKQIDLIITDILMPEKDGIEIIMELRQDFPEAKAIAISGGGHIDPENYLNIAKRAGAIRTLTKPFGMNEVLRVVREIID